MIFFKKKFDSLDECIQSRYGKYLIRKYGYNSLHLCIYFGMPEWIDNLRNISLLKSEKSYLGLTPIILALWLNRKNCLKKLNFYYNHKIKLVKNDEVKYLTIQAFEQFFGIEYLSHLEFSSPYLLNKVIKRIKKVDQKNKLTQQEKWLGAYYKDNIILDNSADTFIKWIDGKKGYGLFANKALKKKKFIGQYTGYLRNSSFKKDQKNAYCFEYITGYKYPENFTIDAKVKGNITRFINHGYQPNLKPALIYLKPLLLITFLTNRDIKEGEELTYDYGPDYWKKREGPY